MWDNCMASATFDDYKAAAEITDSCTYSALQTQIPYNNHDYQ